MPETGPLIVLADDNPDILKLVTARLGKRGYEIASAEDGQTALDLIRERRPAAAVLDWVMPRMSGEQVCAAVKGDDATASIPVILLTAQASEDHVMTGFSLGADEYLTKPFDIEELDDALRRLTAAG